MRFLGVIFILAFIGVIYSVIIQIINRDDISEAIIKALDVITVIFLSLER